MAYYDEVIADSPYAYWRMGDASSPIQDETAGNRDMTIANGTFGVAGAVAGNNAVQFNGTASSGSVALDLSDTNVVTLEFWLYWNAFANDDDIAFEFTADFNSGNGFLVDPNSSDGSFSVAMHETGAVYNDSQFTRPSAAAWHHYVVVFNRAQADTALKVIPYVDGSTVSYTKSGSGAISANFASSTLYVMARNNASLFGAGRLDEVAIYKSALSSTRIAAHYTAGTTSGTTFTKSGLAIIGP